MSESKTAEQMMPKVPGAKSFQKVVPVKDEGVYNLAVGDPDADVSDLGEIKVAILDDAPEGTDLKAYRYIWVPANPKHIPAGLRALINEGVGRPVSPKNHPKVPARLFTGEELVVMDAVLWYFNKERAEKHLRSELAEARDKMNRLKRVGENQIAVVAGEKYEGPVR